MHARPRTHQYAVTKASQIGNSLSQFSFNDHRGNVNVSGVAGASRYSLPVSVLVLCGTRSEMGRGWETEWREGEYAVDQNEV